MKAKRWISLLLAVSMMLGVLAMPASAAAQQPESTAVVSEELPDAAALSAAEDENDIVSIRIRATGNLVYGSDYKLEVETRPENTQYIAVVLGTSGEAYEMMKLTAQDLYRDGIVEEVIPEPLGGAQRGHAALFERMDAALRAHLKELCRMSGKQLADQRYKKYRQIGETRSA